MRIRDVAALAIVTILIKAILILHQFSSFVPDFLVRKIQYVLPVTTLQLDRSIRAIVEEQPGSYAVYVSLVDPQIDRRPLAIRADVPFPGASLAKLYIIGAAFDAIEKGTLSLSQPVPITKDMQANGNYGTGILRFRLGFTNPYTHHYYPPNVLYNREDTEGPYSLSLGDLLYLSIRYSDNTAVLAVAETVGREVVQQYIQKLGLTHTSILAYDEKGEIVRPNMTTARDVGLFLALLYRKRIIPRYADYLLSWLEQTEESDRIVYPLPPTVRVMHKTAESSEDGVYHDAGILTTPQGTALMLVALSQQPAGSKGEFAQTQISVLRAIARLVYNHMLMNEQLFFLPHVPGVRHILKELSL